MELTAIEAKDQMHYCVIVEGWRGGGEGIRRLIAERLRGGDVIDDNAMRMKIHNCFLV